MNYSPGVSYRGDQWIMQGGQQTQQAMTALLQYLLGRGNQASELRAQAESLAGLANGEEAAGGSAVAAPPGSEGDNSGGLPGQGTGGFNPVTPVASGEESGPSPAMAAGNQADAIRKLVKAYAPEAKDLHSGLKALSLDQLEGMLKGYGMKQSAAEHQAKLADYQAQAALRRQQAMDDQTVGKLVKAYGMYEPEDVETAAPGERLREAFKQVPEAGGRVLPKAIEALTRYEQLINPKAGEENLTTSFSEDPISHMRFANRGKILQPSGVNPEYSQPKNDWIHDPDGNLVGVAMTDARGHTTMQKLPGGFKAKAVVDENGNPTGIYQVGDKLMHQDALSAFMSQQRAATSKTNAATPVLKMVRDKDGKLVIQK